MTTTTAGTTGTPTVQDQAQLLRQQHEQLRRKYAEATAAVDAALTAAKAALGNSLTGMYDYLSAHASAHPLVAALIPQVRHAVELYRADQYQAASQQLAVVDATITVLHELEPAIPARQ